MSAPAVRPTFELSVADPPAAVMERLRARLPRCRLCTGVSAGDHAELYVPVDERRLWSPWLSVTVEAGSGGSLVRGRFSPQPGVWTLYMFLAFALGFALLVGGSWGYAQWVMEQRPWALLSLPACLALGAGLYSVSLLGQRLSHDQMDHLHSALEELVAVGEPTTG